MLVQQFAKTYGLANLKLEIDKLGIDKLEKAPSRVNNLKSKVDEIDICKLKTSPTDLSKLSNVAKNV